MGTYPKLVRLAVLRESDAGKTTRQVAKEFNCSPAWVRRVKQERRELCKYGPYRNRRPNRHKGTLRDRVKAVLIEDASITVEELQRVFGPELTTELLVIIREIIFINNGIVWHGADGSLPPTNLYDFVVRVGPPMTSPSQFPSILKQRLTELLDWRPQLNDQELEHILGIPVRGETIVEAKTEMETNRAIQARLDRERAEEKFAAQWYDWKFASSKRDYYPSI